MKYSVKAETYGRLTLYGIWDNSICEWYKSANTSSKQVVKAEVKTLNDIWINEEE